MSKIIRTEPGSILSKAVEYHGFVYLPGITARDTSKDIKGQTADVLEQIDQMLETHGTDKTRLLQALIWVKHIKDRAAMNEVVDAVAAAGWRSGPRLRAGGTGQPGHPGRDHGDGLQVTAERLPGSRAEGGRPVRPTPCAGHVGWIGLSDRWSGRFGPCCRCVNFQSLGHSSRIPDLSTGSH